MSDVEGRAVEDNNNLYWKTLQRLVQTKIDLDFEHSPNQDFNELRDDLKNMIVEEFKKRFNKEV